MASSRQSLFGSQLFQKALGFIVKAHNNEVSLKYNLFLGTAHLKFYIVYDGKLYINLYVVYPSQTGR